jgi:hypothetical protein
MMFNPTYATLDTDALRARIDGELYSPADEEWDVARGAWNLAVDQHPALVAMPASAADVVELVRVARAHDLTVSVQGTGHNASAYGPLGETLLLKTSKMNDVSIDPRARTARVGAGAVWSEVVGPAAEHGLAALQGSSHDVGVVGYSLGGGVSFLGRKHGLASERIRSIEIVTADGELRRVDAANDPDLFWALRGGGGNFGVVTEIEIELLELNELYAGALFFEHDRSAEVLGAWREWVRGVPEEMTSVGRMLQFPPLPEIPEPLRGNSFVVVEAFWLGGIAEGAALLEPLRALGPVMDTMAMIRMPELMATHMDPPEPVPGHGDHQMLADLDADAIDAVVKAAGPGSGSPLVSVEFRHIGGALGRRMPGAGALGALEGEFMTFSVAMVPGPEFMPAIVASLKDVREALAPVDNGANYLNFAEHAVEPESIYGSARLARLREVKAAYDPEGLFRGNHPIEA